MMSAGLFMGSVQAQERLPEYLQAEKFTGDKLRTMLFTTTVDPHWFQQGNCFWYTYKTSEGTFWYVVNPNTRSNSLLFDRTTANKSSIITGKKYLSCILGPNVTTLYRSVAEISHTRYGFFLVSANIYNTQASMAASTIANIPK